MPRGWWEAAVPWWPATVVRGVWCPWALSLPRSPALFGGQPEFRDPYAPGAVGAGVGTRHRPYSAHPCELAWRTVGVAEKRPRGGAFTVVKGVCGQALPLSRLPALGAGCRGPALFPWLARPVGVACRGGGGGSSPGEVACHRCEGRLVSGAFRPPAARPLGRAAGVPRPVCPWCGRCGRGDPAPAPQRAPLQAGVAHCGGGGRASPEGCLPPL